MPVHRDDTSCHRPWLSGGLMEILIPIAVLGVWLILQIWVLPRLGVPT